MSKIVLSDFIKSLEEQAIIQSNNGGSALTDGKPFLTEEQEAQAAIMETMSMMMAERMTKTVITKFSNYLKNTMGALKASLTPEQSAALTTALSKIEEVPPYNEDPDLIIGVRLMAKAMKKDFV